MLPALALRPDNIDSASCALASAPYNEPALPAPTSSPPAGRVRVWAFSPPGGLCDAPLSAALAPNTVAVMVGKDAVPRTSAGTVAGLVEEGLVGLARLR